MSEPSAVVMHQWLAGKIPPAAQVLIDRLARGDDVARVAIMPDVHAAEGVCVGTVLATRRLIYPSAVGGDIGCGMAVVAFDTGADLLAREPAAVKLLAALRSAAPVNRHAQPRVLPMQLQQSFLSDPRLEVLKHRDAAVQLGTLGRGNHFLEFQADAEGRLWMMVHSGSRAVGQAVRDWHVRDAPRGPVGLAVLDARSTAGQAYLSDAAWAATYAAANRRAMVEATMEVVRTQFGVTAIEGTFMDCDHNHVRLETHFGQPYFVHRKGATPAAEGQPGVIPGSMATASFHVEGRGHPDALCSSSHGAGRLMSRHEARQRVSPRDLQRQLGGIWYDPHLNGALCEESPAAYKDIRLVMRAQRELTRIVRSLLPVLCHKGGS